MDVMLVRVFSGMVLVALTSALSAQQLLQPPAQHAVRLPAKTTLGTGDGSQLRQATPAPAVPSDPAQRPAAKAQVADKGPASVLPSLKKPVPPLPAAPRPVAVIDSKGRPVHGTLQVAPNRIYDPASGRYHWTVPSGQQQKIID